ncbi:MAG: methylisocitrate lyase [Candidatus Hydrogenedentes bacterium]|nr:methylisocitrate lyase [Candidatus Hydrogenedentota bacterium]
MSLPAERADRLRQLLAAKTVALPGAINALSARLIERVGFEALYVSGAVLSNSVGGMPDVGLMTLTELASHCAYIARATDLPIVADADTGFGGPENAAHTVRVLEALGVCGIHIEDQEFPKRCGHLAGKQLVDAAEFCEKIAAAAEAKSSPDFLLIARTDAYGVSGYDEAVDRAHRYLEAGADAIFPEALESVEELKRFAADVDTLLLANMTEFGKTPYLTVDGFADLGYNMVIFPVTLQRVAMKAMEDALILLHEQGTQYPSISRMQTRQDLYELLGYEPQRPRGDTGI